MLRTDALMGRGRAIAGAALVLGLLVLPPAISAGQDTAADVGTTTTPEEIPPPEPSPAPPADGSAAPGANDNVGEQEAAEPPEGSTAAEALEVSTGPAGDSRRAKRRFARAAANAVVSIGDNFYAPVTISISVGDTIPWSNDGQSQHSATANEGSFDTGIFGPGVRRSHTFNRAGHFDYYCLVHGKSQSGTVRVSAKRGGGGGGTGGAGASGPSEADAVASADAAGSSSSLPSTGSNGLLPPIVIGLLLLAAGLTLRLRNWIRPA
jgi:LPXTG-motif cell wall-anchored protein